MTLIKNIIFSFKKTSCRYFSSAIQENKIKIGDLNINHVLTGQGPHTLFFLPGALGTAWTDFKPQLEGLDRNKFTIIAWDPPGYGSSRPPDRDFDNENFLAKDADIALKLIEALNVKKCSLLGWSDGGISAMIMAGKRPDLLNKLVIWGSNSFVSEVDKSLIEKIADLSAWSEKMKAPLIKTYGQEYFEKMWNNWVSAYIGYTKKKGGNICIEYLPEITAKTLILHGQKDPLVDPVHSGYLADNIKESSLFVFKDGKHNIHLRYAEEFNRRVTDFLIH